ncbi:MAG: class II fructose-bisphosphate aldolase, partial [Candidatus Omnitrophica bacterium]|nr:class II fructose-bisphosphate aldolase [Candidatus Omnitrophota bacterium]
SINDFYLARGREKFGGFTVPAINIRSMTFYLASAIFRTAKTMKAGAFIFEIAKSEMGYTDQKPVEYAAMILAAALSEGYKGPVFIQGDHFQFNAKKFAENRDKEVDGMKTLIREAVAAGFFNIDIDSSTLVDLTKTDVMEEQKWNFQMCGEMTKFIRTLEPKGVTISVGGEIGEVGKKNSTPEELRAFMTGYKQVIGPGTAGISKMSIQTGTSHGGVVLPDGTVAKVKLDFDTLCNLSKIARDEFGMAGAVQHGASTLPEEAFGKFVEVDAAEVHLATQFQNMIYDDPAFPKGLKDKMYAWLKENAKEEMKDGQTEEQFFYKARKKALGPFKKDILTLPAKAKDAIIRNIEGKFALLFTKLNIKGTADLLAKYAPSKPIKLTVTGVHQGAHLDGEGDD